MAVEKVAYSAFYMSRLEWVLRKAEITTLLVAGIVTNGGVASTVRDAHVRENVVRREIVDADGHRPARRPHRPSIPAECSWL